MKLFLEGMKIVNFKKIRSLELTYKQITDILGQNKAGKSTIMDAYNWALFGKNSEGRTDFSIKTLDENNQPYHRLEHEVTLYFNVDGQKISIRRMLKEKWEKPKGQKEEVFKGHTNSFFWNEVPMIEREFLIEVGKLVDENLFRLVSSPSYFNSLPWQDRRRVLLQMVGTVDTDSVLDKIATVQNKTEMGALITALNQGKTLEQYKKQVAAEIKLIKDEKEMLPSRIDEATRSLPDAKDYEDLQASVELANEEIQTIEKSLLDKNQAQKDHQNNVTNLLHKKQELSRQVLDIEYSERNKVDESKRTRRQAINNKETDLRLKEGELRNKQTEVNNSRAEYVREQERKETLLKDQEDLRNKYTAVDAEVLEVKDGEYECPTCKRDLEETDKLTKQRQLMDNFNTDKSKRLNELKEKGTKMGADIADIDVKLGNIKARGEKLNNEIDVLNSEITLIKNSIIDLEEENIRLSQNDQQEYEKNLANNTQYHQYKTDIENLNTEINKPLPEDKDQLLMIDRKNQLRQSIDGWKSDLSTKDQRERIEKRINELRESEEALSARLASAESIDYLIDQFNRTQMDELERRVNTRFKIVKFKMFKEQVNGGRDEACTTLVDGVPYADVNTAGKVQAGLDIVNVLSQHYNIYAPVWIDCRESTTDIPETDLQIINLKVSDQHEGIHVF